MQVPPRTSPTRILTGLACLLVLCVLGLAPRSHLVVCLAKLGGTAAATKPSCCEHCCEVDAPTRDDRPALPGEDRASASCPAGCCIDLETRIELGPTPRSDATAMSDAIATPPPPVPTPQCAPHPATGDWPHDTGPPRTDRGTALRRTTVLLL